MQNIRVPRQKRSIETRQRIMKSAFQLFAQKGIHGTNSKEIVKQAGVSIGSFYSYFENKKTLLLEMLEEYLDQVFTSIWGPMTGVSFESIRLEEVRLLIENSFCAYEIAPEFHRQTHALRYSDPDINRIFERERNREAAQIQNILKSNLDLENREDLFATAVLMHNLVESAIHTFKFLGPKVEKKDLIQQLSLIIMSYVQVYESQDYKDHRESNV